jgi:hypothetical protein
MKKLLVSAVLAFVPMLAFPQDRSLGVALERFGVVSGGWWLNQRCKFLAAEEAAAFGRDLAVVNTSLTTSVANPNMVVSIQGSARMAAEAEKYASCSAEAQDIVKYSAAAAGQWSNEIRRIVLEAATRLPGAQK